jgi:peptidoglycan hydrolase-like protein with peptidoglycan-binding domain
MTSPIDMKPLRYLIAKDGDAGEDGTVTLTGYNTTATTAPTHGIAAGYVNRRQEEGERLPGVSYLPPDDIEHEYGEPAPTPGTAFFWQNINTQLDKWLALNVRYIDMDNLDTDNATVALSILNAVFAKGMFVYLKNPNLIEGDKAALVRHSAAAAFLCEQDDDLTAGKLDELRRVGGKPELPIRVVSYGDGRAWAMKIAEQAVALKLKDFGVTYSTQDEYGSVEHILKPTGETVPTPPVTSPAPWVDTLEGDIGRYHDGPDVPMLAQSVGRLFPTHASYAAVAGQGTAWCGIFAAFKLSPYGIEPPYDGQPGVNSWMYVDSWRKLKGGTSIPPDQRKDGDLCLWISSSLHHISFAWKGKFLGGNQNNTVNVSSFRTPDYVIRPPAPTNYTPQPEMMPMLMIESSGDAVRVLQTMLNENGANLELDGEFGPDTETAVKAYQTQHPPLEVDGVVGPATWESLFEKTPPIEPKPPEDYLLTPKQIADITAMAGSSSIATFSWADRGKMPLGCTKGLAVMYAQCVRKLEANDSAVLVMTQPIGYSAKDALAYYTISATGRANVLRKLFVMLYGLSMRESSGNYTEGRDISASNVTADTAEAGMFQQSWNSSSASVEMKKLLPAYEGTKQPCYSSIFKEGITVKNTTSYGTGPGRQYQDQAKACPAFAVEMCGVGLRVLYNHWGPVVRQEVQMRAEAEALLIRIDDYLKDQVTPPPIEPPVEPPVGDIAIAKAKAMDSIEKAINTLITDILRATVTTTVRAEAAPAAVTAMAIPDNMLRYAWPKISTLNADQIMTIRDKIVGGEFNLNDLFGVVVGEHPLDPPTQPEKGTGMSDSFWMNIRYALIAGGVALLVKYSGGLFTPENAEQIITPLVGGLIALGTAVWGNYVRSKTKAVPEATAKRSDIETVSPVTGAVEPGNVYR